jgi:hypothetical protein
VPNALGARGANLPLCRWLLALGRAGADVRVMFHEPYFYFSWHPLRSGLAVVQRLMAAVLLRAARRAYVATDQWRRYLAPYAPAGTTFTVLPIPSTLPCTPPPGAVAGWRARFGGSGNPVVVHFGTYGDHVARMLRPLIPLLLREQERVRLACIGRGSESFVAAIAVDDPGLGARVVAAGGLAPADAAAAIAAGDVALQPFPDGITTRRTSAMAPLCLGVPLVTSRGFLTEDVWSDAVGLCPASDVPAHAAAVGRLLADPSARQSLGAAGKRLYAERFALERTVETLLTDLKA